MPEEQNVNEFNSTMSDGAIDAFQAVDEMVKPDKPRDASGRFAATDQASAPRDGSLPLAEEEAAPPDPIQEPVEEPDTETPEDHEGELDTQETDPVEATEQDTDPEEVPLIDPPASWSAEAREEFANLPREAQEIITSRETDRDREVRRLQNETVTIRQEAQAAATAAEQARQQYEATLPQMLQSIQNQMMGEFSDIQSWEDAQKLQQEDPFRFQQFQLAREHAAAVQQEDQTAKARQQQEQATNFNNYVEGESKRFLELAPEYADEKQAPKLHNEARALFSDLGVSDDILQELWNGTRNFSLRSHEAQMIVRDAVRYRMAKQATKTAKAKPVRPAQKSGTARSKGEASQAQLADLEKQLSQSGDIDDALAFMKATGRA